ncbi:MAG: hypothetical protein V3S24_07245 [Candidatus Tectomicrobia bacterium]
MQQSDMSTMQVLPALTATDSPSVQQWQTWWNAMQHDDLAVAYADTFPRTLADFRYDIARRNKLLLLCLADHEVAGALWLHDLTHRPGSTVAAGWIGGYFLPSYRGGNNRSCRLDWRLFPPVVSRRPGGAVLASGSPPLGSLWHPAFLQRCPRGESAIASLHDTMREISSRGEIS